MKIAVLTIIVFMVLAGTALCGTEDTEVMILEPKHRDAADLFPAVMHLKSKEGTITIDHRTDSLIVVDYPENLKKMRELISKLDTPLGQVQIKVVVAEVKKSFLQRAGIGLGMSVIPRDHLKRINYLMENKDEVSVRSEMSVRTLTGKPATIKVAREEILWSVAIDPEHQTRTLVEPALTRSAGNFLTVLPRVHRDGTITVMLMPTVSEFQEDRSTIYEKTLETRVRIKSGDTISIGGFEGARSQTKEVKVPFADMSFSERAGEEKKKVLIFLTAETEEDFDAF